MTKKEVTFHINNMAYTLNIDEEVKGVLTKYLDLNNNNDTKDLLKAYLELTYEYRQFQKEVEDITNKLIGL
ncbi:hypothetical protein [Aliarcobacter butzleri]|uniref:Uncharacterized protein n=7 Tax=root TaxID=1 RepID=A8EUM8_ALIB4|nr:hypothetical protein [Aliarcobacter butzleri]MCP3649382.1 hypothetical protein [Arcobacter sp. DNRA7]ABV67652.1 hypothetical protein Abu_1397 [Aliarcobacter butzleri RM4018]AGR77697.1 hypothetical protein A7H1H_1412 [Aliarcobacter butzleri 7h1h]EFU69025.1 conserved hypothetical protein [Aliarcobacter butzleri JV22]KLD96146.1 hypothetical protein AA20_12355 [Aliarcobacter butzleri L348]